MKSYKDTYTLRLFTLSRLPNFSATMRGLQILLRESHEITVKTKKCAIYLQVV